MVPTRIASPRAALLAVLAVCAALAAGCAAPYELTYPEPRPLGATLPTVGPEPEEAVPDTPRVALDGPLTLAEAVVLAPEYNPALRAAAYAVRAREGEAYQARRPPNPEVEAGIEEFGGTRGRTGLRAAEIGGGIAQTIELGGDRRARAAVAAREAELGAWAFEAARLRSEERRVGREGRAR